MMLLVTAVLIALQVGTPAGDATTPPTDHPENDQRVGVVWTPPESPFLATAELASIRGSGIRLVRTGSVLDPVVLAMADSLGMTIYRELPIKGFSAQQLSDSTAFARVRLSGLLASGMGHPSAGPIGLAVHSDVSDPDSCPFFENVRRSLPLTADQEFYYVSSFVEDDACSNSVDFVIIDALDRPDPARVLDAWTESHASDAGITVGWWVDTDARRGLGIPHSEEEQARALEQILQAVPRSAGGRPFFVHRWGDQTRTQGGEMATWDIYGRHYGLRDAFGRARPSLDVLRSFLTTGQSVFALPRAASRGFTFPWYVLLGWSLILIVAVLYASSPRFRYMLPRYFMAHGFFRNAVREAREVLPIVSTALLTVMGIAEGLIGTQVFLVVHDTEPVRHFIASLPYQVQAVIIAMLDGPLLAVILIGSLSLLAIAGWMGLWMIVASRKAPLLPSQALMLGVWPRWQLLILLPMAMSIHTLPVESAMSWMWLLVPLWVGTAFWASFRTTYDLFKITHCGRVFAIIVWFLNPVWITLMVLLILAIAHGDHVLFLWHLATRS